MTDTCAQARWLDAYFDRELDLSSSLQIEEHLLECSRCRALLESHKLLREALRNPAMLMRRRLPRTPGCHELESFPGALCWR